VPLPKCAKPRHGGCRPRKEKAARRRLSISNLLIVDYATVNAGFDFRR
jgi:hypothetical protein